MHVVVDQQHSWPQKQKADVKTVNTCVIVILAVVKVLVMAQVLCVWQHWMSKNLH